MPCFIRVMKIWGDNVHNCHEAKYILKSPKNTFYFLYAKYNIFY